jgi:meso-butanediol dehydrogenase/(S,S)-butanediol dehydrogenase/diacetyl reductase
MRLREQVALITGAGRGIGRSIALALAREGADVAVAARSEPEIAAVRREVEGLGRRGLACVCEVTDATQVARLVQNVQEALGPITILVNNAGMAASAKTTEMDDALWERILRVNLTGTYLCTKAVLPGMLTRSQGRIINIASIGGKVGLLYSAAYCASKHGVLGFTRALALEVAGRGITVNAICPGFVETAMTDESIRRIVMKTGRTPDAARQALEGLSPQKRLIQPEEVATVAVMLASPEARGIHGQAINVDGGAVMF